MVLYPNFDKEEDIFAKMDEIEKFTYDRFSNKDKAEFMKTRVLREETSLRQRTDTILQSETALELVLENQRYFAQY